MNRDILKKLGFSDKSTQVYLALLALGPSSVRTLAEYCGLNRGTTYDALKWLEEHKIVSFYNKDTKQSFVAEDPATLQGLVREQEIILRDADKQLERIVPELQALHHKGGERPVARYYEKKDIPLVLQDVLDTCSEDTEKMYRSYSVAGIREYLYEHFPTFSDVRIAKGIQVRVIAIGDGGELRGLDERKWLGAPLKNPTFFFIYPGKTAAISLNAKGEPVAVVIENQGIYETQRAAFDALWEKI